MASLNKDELIGSARECGERAVSNYINNQHGAFFVDAAISLEHTCKAYLVSLNPALVADISRKDFDSLLHLCGLERHAKRDHPKTISGTEALERVRKIIPGMTAPQDPLRKLVDVRDGVIHAGFLPTATARDSFVAFLRARNEISDALGVPDGERWGNHKKYVDDLISLTLSGVEEEVRRQVEAARQRYQKLMESVPESLLPSVLTARYESAGNLADEEEANGETPCPACEQKASCAGSFDVDWEVDAEWEDGGTSYYPYPVVTIYPDRLSCPICNLKLDGRDQLISAGVPSQWEAPTSSITEEALDAAAENASDRD